MVFIPANTGFWIIGVIVVELILITLAIFAVVIRIWARRLKKIPLYMNDYMIVIALVLSAGFVAGSLTATFIGGQGQHIQYTNPAQVTVLLKCFVALEILWSTANTAAKLSILHLYIQIFRNRTFRYIAISIMVLTCCYCVIVVLEAFVVCRPFAYNWNKTIVNGVCGNQAAIYLSTGIMNLLLDVMIIVLPMPMLWGLQLALTKKAALTIIFGMGTCIVIITILRIIYVKSLDFQDITYSNARVGLLSSLEPTLSVINACLPVMYPVLHKISGLFSTTGILLRRRAEIQQGKPWISGKGKGVTVEGESNSGGFRRLDDCIRPSTIPKPLRNITAASERESHLEMECLEAKLTPSDMETPQTAIMVRREWEVI